MVLKSIETGREIDIDFNFFREEYADAIKEAFSKIFLSILNTIFLIQYAL